MMSTAGEIWTSRSPIPVDRPFRWIEHVIGRIQQLKSMEVMVRAGRSRRRQKVVKFDGPDDLVPIRCERGSDAR